MPTHATKGAKNACPPARLALAFDPYGRVSDHAQLMVAIINNSDKSVWTTCELLWRFSAPIRCMQIIAAISRPPASAPELLRRQARFLHHLFGAGAAGLDVPGEFLRCIDRRNQAAADDVFLAEARIAHHLHDLAVELVDDCLRRAGGREQPVPGLRRRAL